MQKSKKRGPGKPHGMNLAQARKHEQEVFDELVRAEAWKLLLEYGDTLQQEVIDAAFMKANDMFHMGPGRCVEFGQGILENLHEISLLVNADYADDPDIVYAKEKIDQRLHRICGGNFEPWEVRYGRKQEGSI